LSKIINARVVEIIEQVFSEIKSYGHEDPRKKLIAGIVLTGGGAQLKHIKQLVEYITGMDTRIGYPNEHLAGNSSEEISNPLFATAVGLVIKGAENNSRSAIKIEKEIPLKNVQPVFRVEKTPEIEAVVETVEVATHEVKREVPERQETTSSTITRGFFEKYVEKIKDFLDKAE